MSSDDEAEPESEGESTDHPNPNPSVKPAEPAAMEVGSGDRKALILDMRPAALGILVVLAIIAIQQGAWVLEPWVFGSLLDSVTSEDREWDDLLQALPAWACIFAVNTLAGGLRRIASERVYARMYARVAAGLARRALATNTGSTQTAALAELGRDFVAFFEERVPEILTDAVSLLGTIGALSAYDHRIAWSCLTVLVPVMIAGRVYDQRVSKLMLEQNALRQRNVEVFGAGDPDAVLVHFNKIADIKRSIGTWNAINFWVLRGALLVVFVVVLYVAIDLDRMSAGDISAVVIYIWTYVTAIETVPDVLEHLAGVRDITARLSGKAPLPVPTGDEDDE